MKMKRRPTNPNVSKVRTLSYNYAASSLAKKEKNKFNNWLANFMILVEELQSTKHNWTPNSESYAHIAR